jgi:rhodanese-related sulfurtransferase
MKNALDLVAEAKGRISEVSVDEAEQAIRDADVLIDLREADEFAAGYIAGAVHIPRGLLEFKLSGTPELGARDLKFVLYCKSSGRSALAADVMQQMGYLNVKSVAGGFDAWLAADKPFQKPSLPSFG